MAPKLLEKRKHLPREIQWCYSIDLKDSRLKNLVCLEGFYDQTLLGNLRPPQRTEFTCILATGETKPREGQSNSWDPIGSPRANTHRQVRFRP